MLKDLFSNRLFIGALAFFVLCVGGSLFYYHHQTQKGEADLAATEDHVRQWNEKQKEQPTAETPVVEQPEQGGHFHADGTFHAEPHAPIEVPAEVETSEATGTVEPSQPAMQLTYHAELLKNDPVEALRQQGKERGHWSADYLPDFPLDDTEAMEIARAEYHCIYYKYQTPPGQPRSPEFYRASRHVISLLRAVNERYPADSPDWHVRARGLDLTMLSWPSIPYDSYTIENYRDYTWPSLVVRSHMYPDLPELGERR